MPSIEELLTGVAPEAPEGLAEAADAEAPVTVRLTSTAIAAATYYPARGAVEITMQRGGTYTYEMSREDFDAFTSSGSPGSYYNANIKRKF